MSSSGPSGETVYKWNPDMQDRMNNQLNRAERLSWDTQFKPYDPNSRFAPLHTNQLSAIANSGSMGNIAESPFDYTDVYGRQQRGGASAAHDQLTRTLDGGYANPYAQASPTGNEPYNPWTDTFRNNEARFGNAFGGMSSPYFNDMLKQGMDDITGAYQKGTSADTTRMFNLAGAFGGSAHRHAVANNEAALAKQLGNYATGLQNEQYNRSAGLEDARLSRGAQAAEGELTRGNAGWQAAQDRGFQGFENERNRQVGLIGAGQNEQSMAMDRIRSLMETGGLAQGQNQKGYDFNYQQFADANNFPFKMNDWLMGQYRQAMGGGAGVTQQAYGYGPSSGQMGMAGLLGLLAAS